MVLPSKPASGVDMLFALQGYATFNDDIQATAAVTLGALMGAQRLPGVPPLRQQTFLFFGAGQANLGAAQLLVRALADEGVSEEDAKRQIWLMDSQVCQIFPQNLPVYQACYKPDYCCACAPFPRVSLMQGGSAGDCA